MLGLKAGFSSWLRAATDESIEEPNDREAGAARAVCRSRDERRADAIVIYRQL